MRECREDEGESVFQKPSNSLTQRDRQADGGTETRPHMQKLGRRGREQGLRSIPWPQADIPTLPPDSLRLETRGYIQYDFQKGRDDNFPFSDKVNSILKGKQKIKKASFFLLSALVPWRLALCTVIHRPQGSPKFNCSFLALLEIGKIYIYIYI